ncbi:MAG TPA: hypothetical protein VEV87_09475, partial [Chitinophagaceae bacterium]|nr:hypothetical protein [Chitinophagaceae bacterium]
INLDVITSTNDSVVNNSVEKYFRIIFNAGSKRISITPINDPFKKYSVILFNSIGQKVVEKKFMGEGTLKVYDNIKGIHTLVIQTGSNLLIKRIYLPH